MSERERRTLLAKAAVEKTLLRQYPELTDTELEFLAREAEVTSAFRAHVAGVERSLDLRGTVDELMVSQTASLIFGDRLEQRTGEALGPGAVSSANAMALGRATKSELG